MTPTTQLYIPIILGTAREGRRSENAARFVLGEVKKRPEIETELVDVRDFRLIATDNSEESETAERLERIVSRADGFIIVTPEYNHGYPGELKMMLDLLYEQYARKPVAICGTGGGLGGVRAVEQLRMVAIEFQMAPISSAVFFANVKTLFDEHGELKERAKYEERVGKLLDELLWYARALKAARANDNE